MVQYSFNVLKHELKCTIQIIIISHTGFSHLCWFCCFGFIKAEAEFTALRRIWNIEYVHLFIILKEQNINI